MWLDPKVIEWESGRGEVKDEGPYHMELVQGF